MSRSSRIRIYRGGEVVAPILSEPTSEPVIKYLEGASGRGETTSASVTLASAPSAGNLVVFYVNANHGTSTAISVDSDTGAAWETDAFNETPTSETAEHGMFWKIADGSEPSTYTCELTSSRKWGACVKVFDVTGTPVISTAANTAVDTTNLPSIRCEATFSETVDPYSLSLVMGGKDLSPNNNDQYTKADENYVSVLSASIQTTSRMAGMAHLIYGETGRTFGAAEAVTIDHEDGDDGASDKAYSGHIAFGQEFTDANAVGTVRVETTSAHKVGGTLYFYTTTNTFQTREDIIDNGESQAVTEDGDQTVNPSGLSDSTTYYIHYCYVDYIGTKSNVVVSRSFVTGVSAAGGAISGTCSIAFGSSASLKGTGDITGTAPIAFGSSADLKGVGDITGTAPIAFGSSADLKGTGSIAGTAPVAFDSSASLKGVGDITGTAPIAFDSSASLTAATSGAITGTCTIAFGSSASLKGTGDITGTVSMTFGSSADLKGTGDISGTAPVAFTTSASLKGKGLINGTSALAFDSSASLKGTGDITGTVTITWGSSASLTAVGVVLGALTGNAFKRFAASQSDVVIRLFDPITGAAVALDSAVCNEVGSTGRYIWEASNLTTQPTVNTEYLYEMTDDAYTTIKEGIVLVLGSDDTATLARVEKLLRNKRVTDPGTGQQTIYDNDGTTPLFEGDIFEDVAGATPYAENGINRADRLDDA